MMNSVGQHITARQGRTPARSTESALAATPGQREHSSHAVLGRIPGARQSRSTAVKISSVVTTDQIEHLFYDGQVRTSGADEQMLAQIADVCRWYAVGGPPTAQRQAAALAELAHITAGRTDLLARYAGQSLASHDAGSDASERAVQLCIIAGADMALIDRWSRPRLHNGTRTSHRLGSDRSR